MFASGPLRWPVDPLRWPVAPLQLSFPLAQASSYATDQRWWWPLIRPDDRRNKQVHYIGDLQKTLTDPWFWKQGANSSQFILCNQKILCPKNYVIKMCVDFCRWWQGNVFLVFAFSFTNCYDSNVLQCHNLESRNQNRRQKVLNRGTLRSCSSAWHSENLTRTPLIYSASYLNMGPWSFVWGAKPTKTPVATRLVAIQQFECSIVTEIPKCG